MDAVTRWREFERLLLDSGLGWGLHYAPAQLRYARDSKHPHGAQLEHLLPADYRAFVAQVGYPVLCYDRSQEGFSFLPPEIMAVQSIDTPSPVFTADGEVADFTFPKSVQGRPTRCLHAFFAGYNLPEFEGYSFGPARDSDEITVWIHYDDGPTETAGTFTEWLNMELGGHEERMAGFDDAAVADLRAADAVPDGPGGRRDPHCLLWYSLGGSYDQAPYTAADLDLTWVVSGDYTLGRSARLKGLIDGSGTWLIPLGDRFRAVRPFRDGVAEVILDTGRGSHVDEWTRIRPDGSIVIEQ